MNPHPDKGNEQAVVTKTGTTAFSILAEGKRFELSVPL